MEQSATGTLVTLRDYLSGTVNDFFDKEETTPRLFVNETSKEEDYGRLITVLTIDETGLKFSDAVGNNMEKEELNVYSDLHSWIPSRGNDSTPLTVALLDDAQPAINPWTENPEIDIQWNEQGTIIFDEIAARLYNPAETYSLEHVLGIFLDKKLLSAPQIRAFKFEGKCTISSEFTLAEAEELANIMKSHALSIPVTIVEIIER